MYSDTLDIKIQAAMLNLKYLADAAFDAGDQGIMFAANTARNALHDANHERVSARKRCQRQERLADVPTNSPAGGHSPQILA